MYQVLPNIDVIKHIYQFKEDLELDEIQMYHGLCPKTVKTTGIWIPRHISDVRSITGIYNKLEKSIIKITNLKLVRPMIIDKNNETVKMKIYINPNGNFTVCNIIDL